MKSGKSTLVALAAVAAVLFSACGASHGAAGRSSSTSTGSSPGTSTSAPPTTAPTTTAGGASTTSMPATTTTAATAVTTPATTTTAPTGWTEQQLLGQLIMVGALYSSPAAAAPDLQQGAGGLIFLGQPAAGTGGTLGAEMADLLRSARVLPFMATDEEGGGIARLSNLTSPYLPWPRDVVDQGWSLSRLTQSVTQIARQMRALGMNMDLAPVLDTANANDPVDYESVRSFSAEGTVAAAFGKAFLEGLSAGGMIGVVKHFPGLGHANGDTDAGSASDPPLPEMANDLMPFQQTIAAGAHVVMMSNVTEPTFGRAPASLSGAAYGFLRGMGFEGVIITDSLDAGAISDYGLTGPQAAVRAIEAGADMAMVTTASEFEASLDGLEAAVASGQLSMSQVIRSVDRIVAVKNLLLPAADRISPPVI